jgi:hypothetical protein
MAGAAYSVFPEPSDVQQIAEAHTRLKVADAK